MTLVIGLEENLKSKSHKFNAQSQTLQLHSPE